jgi:hypothetical protein
MTTASAVAAMPPRRDSEVNRPEGPSAPDGAISTQQQAMTRKTKMIKLAVTAGFLLLLVISGIACTQTGAPSAMTTGQYSALGQGQEWAIAKGELARNHQPATDQNVSAMQQSINKASAAPTQDWNVRQLAKVLVGFCEYSGSGSYREFGGDCGNHRPDYGRVNLTPPSDPSYTPSPNSSNNSPSGSGGSSTPPGYSYDAPAPAHPPAPAPPATPDACTIITQSDVIGALGSGYESPIDDHQGNCEYDGQLKVLVLVGNANQINEAAGGTPVAGIGDRAFLANNGPNENQEILVWKGQSVITITLENSNNNVAETPALDAALRSLATTAVERII